MIIHLDSVAGFISNDRNLRVYDEKGNKFYFFDSDTLHKFNLPKGMYTTNNSVHRQTKPFDFKRVKLPKRERKVKIPKGINLTYSDNPNKCSIYFKNDGSDIKIVCDHSLKSLPPFYLIFVFFHEIGHLFYKSEEGADAFAFNKMLERGYNISQCVEASNYTLSEFAHERKKHTLLRAKKTKIK